MAKARTKTALSARAQAATNAALPVRTDVRRRRHAGRRRGAGTSAALPVRIGVSSCLLGAEVRYDGGHRRDRFLVRELGPYVEWVPVCPELEVGMGVPREPVRLVRLVRAGRRVRMVGVESGRDWTEAAEEYARRRVRTLEGMELSGYVTKSRSPSCGLEVEVRSPSGAPAGAGRGLFAAELARRLPWLPIEEESRLRDPAVRERFLERVFWCHRWLLFRRERYSPARLEEFHRRHALLLLARSAARLRRLERIAARAKGLPPADVLREYGRVFFEALQQRGVLP
ncbi:MAG: DUF523 domain-containing protein [Planctomycetes bacterium]|nr:DUF523 domain-containing protein [Planctomycetota bacterium]